MYSNFNFLTESWPDLAQLGETAETYLFSDPNSCMTKAGMLCEELVNKVLRLERIFVPQGDRHYDHVEELMEKDIISQDVYRYLDIARVNRNKAQHRNFASLSHAKVSLQSAYYVASWFMEVYGDLNYTPKPYVEPTNISHQVDYADIIAEHEKKLEELSRKLAEMQASAEAVLAASRNLPVEHVEEILAVEAATKTLFVASSDKIETLELSVRSVNALHRAKIFTVAQMMNMSEEELLGIKNLGRKSVDEILSAQKRVQYDEKKQAVSNESASDAEELTNQELSIEKLNLSNRSYGALARNGINTVGQLMSMSPAEIKAIPALGEKSLSEILEKIENIKRESSSEMDSTSDVNLILERYFTKRDVPVTALGFEERVKNGLLKSGIENFSALVVLTDYEIERLKSIGAKSAKQIIDVKNSLIGPVLAKIESGALTIDNVDDKNEDDIDNALMDIFMSSVEAEFSLVDIVSKVSGTMELSALSASIARLGLKGKITLNNNGTYGMKLPSVREVAEKIEKESFKKVLLGRLSGKTLEEVGQELKVTRKRVGQLEVKSLEAADKLLFQDYGLTKYAEDRFAEIASIYDIPKEAWIEYIGASKDTWNYIKLRKLKGTKSPEEALDESTVHSSIKQGIQDYLDRDYIIINDVRVKKTKPDIEDYLIMNRCQNDTTLNEFLEMYKELIEKLGLSEDEKVAPKEGESRVRENKFSKSDITLCKHGRRFRYYDMRNKSDFDDLYQTLALEEYHNIEFSAWKLFYMYPELMKEYDIHDGEELHNLLRKTYDKNVLPELDLGRMPMLKFGEFDRDYAVFELMLEKAPISKEELIRALVEEFGVQKATAGSWLTCLDMYYHQGMYRVDQEQMPADHQEKLLENLTEDFYFLSELRKIYHDVVEDADERYLSPYTLKGMGFHVYRDYAVRNDNAQEFFKRVLTENTRFSITDINRKYGRIHEYNSALGILRHDYSIIEIEPSIFVSNEVIAEKGFTREKMARFCDQVAEFVEDEYFTIKSLRDSGFDFSEIESEYGDWFYASILREDNRFRYQRAYPQVIFRKTQDKVSRKALIIEVITEESIIRRRSLISMLNQEYGIVIDNADIELSIADTEIYLDKVNDTLYSSYGMYRRQCR